MNPLDPSFIKDVKSWHDDKGSFFIEFSGIPDHISDEMKAGFNILLSQWPRLRYKVSYRESAQKIRAEIKYCPEPVSKALEKFIDDSDPEHIKSMIEKNQERES